MKPKAYTRRLTSAMLCLTLRYEIIATPIKLNKQCHYSHFVNKFTEFHMNSKNSDLKIKKPKKPRNLTF